MEDAARALLMAGNVLIFLIALTVCISSFSSLRAGVDNIIGQTETVQMVQDEDSEEYINFIQSRENGAVRTVGPETVISSMYRAVKEDYVIYIKIKIFSPFTDSDFKQYNYTASHDEGNLINTGDNLIRIMLTPHTCVGELIREKVYNQVKDLTFFEYLGEYKEAGDTNEEERKTCRVITYIDKNCLP